MSEPEDSITSLINNVPQMKAVMITIVAQPNISETSSKGRVERMAETFQDCLLTELRLAGASSIGEANSVLEQFLPRFNRRFRVPPQYPEPAFRPLDPELCLERSCTSSTSE